MEKNENKQFQCSGDCLRCLPVQRQYCAAQHAYNSMMLIRSMQESIAAMTGTIEELKLKIEAIQDNEAMVFATNEIVATEPQPSVKEIAQDGDGAEE